MDAKIAEGEKIIADYKEAFLATGGTEEQWAEKDNTVSVTYDIKSQTDTTVSFVVDSYVSIASSYQEQVYYNLDLAANREIALADLLGENWVEICNESIRTQMAESEDPSVFFSEDMGGFTTVDLLQVDLFSGESQLFKLGAAPSYVKKGSAVQRLSGTSLPAGLAEGEQGALDQFTLKLSPGDTVLMVSDGICGTGEDQWVKDKLAQFDGASPKDLARELITDSPKEVTDDRTALVIRIEKRAAGQTKPS